MRHSYQFLIFLCISTLVFGVQKQSFDIIEYQEGTSNSVTNSLSRIPYPGWDYGELGNNILEVDLLRSGHFTLGTLLGTDASVLDNDQPLSFGHPLAKTSYALLEIDAVIYRLDTYYTEDQMHINELSETSMELVCVNGIINTTFSIELDTQEQNMINFSLSSVNVDIAEHSVRSGFIFDPALGQWGDGAISIESAPLSSQTSYTGNTSIATIQIDERRLLNTGMQLFINFPDALPDEILVDNWYALAGYQTAEITDLYDAAIQWLSNSETLAVSETIESTFDIELTACDFPNGPYLRSQIPQMLDVYENVVSPSNLNCFTIIENNGGPTQSVQLILRNDTFLQEWTSPAFTIGNTNKTFQQVPISIPELYEDRVYPITLELMAGSTVLSVIQRPLFIPASFYSDTGLVVVADTVITTDYPQVATRVNVTNAVSGQTLFDLEPENFFVWEDQTRIYDFSVGSDTTSGVGAADVVFVLDVTGSMGGEIDQVKTYLGQFATALAGQNIDFRLGMVTFLDVIENIYDFTSDVALFQTYIDAQYAHGGGDVPENSLDALYAATQFQFRDSAGRIFIWITDAGYHINNSHTPYTQAEIVDAMLANGVTCHGVSGESIRIEYIDPIIYPTGGDWYNINGNFLDILLDIANLGGSTNYLINYTTPNTEVSNRTVTVEVHQAGLGGVATIEYAPPAGLLGKDSDQWARCYPNPFNPSVIIDVKVPVDHVGEAEIYNVRGQLVRRYSLSRSGSHQLSWNATNGQGQLVSAGLYLVQITLRDTGGGDESSQLLKIVHTN